MANYGAVRSESRGSEMSPLWKAVLIILCLILFLPILIWFVRLVVGLVFAILGGLFALIVGIVSIPFTIVGGLFGLVTWLFFSGLWLLFMAGSVVLGVWVLAHLFRGRSEKCRRQTHAEHGNMAAMQQGIENMEKRLDSLETILSRR